jgi:hypothetical protein
LSSHVGPTEDMVVVNPPAVVDTPSTAVHSSITAVDLSTSMVLSTATSGCGVDSTSSMVLAAAYNNTDSPLVALDDNIILDLQAIIDGGISSYYIWLLFNSLRIANKNCHYISLMSSYSSALLSKICTGHRSPSRVILCNIVSRVSETPGKLL